VRVFKEVLNGILLLSTVTGLGLACLVEFYYICITLLSFILIIILNYRDAMKDYYGPTKK